MLEEHSWVNAAGQRKRPVITLRVGMPNHFKNRCDLEVCQHNNIIHQYTRNHAFHTVEDVRQGLQRANDTAVARDATVVKEYVHT